MRTRLLAIAGLSVVLAGCGASTPHAAGGHTAPSATSSVAPTVSPAAAGTASSPPGPACTRPQAATVGAGALTGLEFVSPAQGWAVGQDTILATSDGGARWTAQLSGNLNLTSVDFVSPRDGWAVGATSLLATTDGGAHWTALPEPCQTIRSVHFISPATGYAVAGGTELAGGENPAVPVLGGVVLTTSDGGRTWRAMTAPANAQSVCFNDSSHGWLGAGGLLYRTVDGGASWKVLTSMAGALGSGTAAMSVECASDGSAWAVRFGPGAAMSQEPHAGFYANQNGAVPLFAEQYFQTPGATPTTESPGTYAGAFSAIDSATAVFVDSCPACGAGTAPWELVTSSGKVLAKNASVGSITEPKAASFQSAQAGWVAGTDTVFSTTGNNLTSKSQARIVATADGGRTWHVEWSGPWTS